MRSPFWGVTKGRMRIYRALAVAVNEWRKDMEAGDYRLPNLYAWVILNNDGGFEQAAILDTFRTRAYDRLWRHPDWEIIRAAWKLERMREYEPEAYQTLMLRKELEQYRKDHPNCCHVLPER